jgi:hypothetical protein
MWRRALTSLTGAPPTTGDELVRPCTDALLEFVPDADPDLLAGEAATLRGWLADAADAHTQATEELPQ